MDRGMSSILTIAFLWSASSAAAQCVDLAPADDGTGVSIGLVISEIDPGNYIEVYNFTSSNIDLAASTFQLCSPFSYASVAGLGVTDVPAKSYATLSWPAAFTDGDAGGEVILYLNGSFGSAASVADFVCWGVNPHGTRKALAESASKWSGSCAAALTGGAIHRTIGADGTTAAAYDTASAPSPLNCSVPSIPTMGEWSLMVLATLLLVAGGFIVRRRTAHVAASF